MNSSYREQNNLALAYYLILLHARTVELRSASYVKSRLEPALKDNFKWTKVSALRAKNSSGLARKLKEFFLDHLMFGIRIKCSLGDCNQRNELLVSKGT